MAARLRPDRVQAARHPLHPLVAKAGVERGGRTGRGAPARAARDRATGGDRCLHRRRHRDSKEGPALGQRGAAVLWPAGQAGQLPGSGEPGASPHARRASPVGWRLYLPEEWARDEERRRWAGVPEDIGFETEPEIALGLNRRAVEEDVPAWSRAGRCRIWQRHEVSGRRRRAGAGRCRRGAGEPERVAAGRGAAAAEAAPGSGPAAEAAAEKRGAQAGVGARTGARGRREGVPDGALAAGRARAARVTLTVGSGAAGAPGLLAQRAVRRALAAGGVAAGVQEPARYWL